MAKELSQEIEAWINAQGYPLEFKTALAMQSAGLAVTQGDHVKDPQTGEYREIDVIGDLIAVASSKLVRLSLVAECKYAPRPWVLFVSGESSSPRVVYWHNHAATSLVQAAFWVATQRMDCADNAVLYPPQPLCHGGCIANVGPAKGKPGKDHLYEALQAVTSRAAAYSQLFEPDAPPNKPDHIPSSGALAVPVVVVQGGLFEARFGTESGRIAVSPVDSTVVFWGGAPTGPYAVPVWVIRDSAVEQCIARLAADLESILKLLSVTFSRIEEVRVDRSLEPLLLPPVHEFAPGFLGWIDQHG